MYVFLMFAVLNIFLCNCLQNHKSSNKDIRTISFGRYRGPSPINLARNSMIRKRSLTSLQFSSEHSKPVKIKKLPTSEGLDVTFSFEHSKPTVSGGVLKFTYEFDKILFHWNNKGKEMGSYHTVDGKYFPMEVQAYYTVITPLLGELLPEIVKNEIPHTLIISQFFELNDDKIDNPAIQSILDEKELSVDKLIPHVTEYAVYRGSFVTPPYAEDAKWIISLKPQKMSKAQLEKFQVKEITVGREIQPLHGRKVFYINSRGK